MFMENIYGLNFSIKSFAVANEFVMKTNKVCYALGQQLQPFCIYANDSQKQANVLDFATFAGFAGGTLLDEVVAYRHDVFKNFGINLDASDPMKKKLLFFDYLMSISACYVEIPKWSTKEGMHIQTFDKFLCTKNPSIMATWMGDEASVMQAKYSSKIQARQVEFNNNEIRFVKLMHSSKGNSITVPRNASKIEEMRVTPLYMIYAFTEGFKGYLNDGILKFSYLKDNGTIRELATTINRDILMDYYEDNLFVNTMLAGVDINTVQQGGMMLASHINRGYIKVPELGASIYDGTGVRALNIARLLKIEKVDSVDRSFIHVDLNSAINNFSDGLDYVVKKQPEVLPDIYRALIGEEPKSEEPLVLVKEMNEYANSRGILLTTTFYRQLHLFMVGNPLWFPLYTGKPNNAVVSSATNVGALPMDF